MSFEVKKCSTSHGNLSQTLLGKIYEDRSVYARGLPNVPTVDLLKGNIGGLSTFHYVGHYEDNGRVYKDTTNDENSLIGYVNEAGKLFTRSGRSWGSVTNEGYICNNQGRQLARITPTEEKKEVDPESFIKMAGAAALLLYP